VEADHPTPGVVAAIPAAAAPAAPREAGAVTVAPAHPEAEAAEEMVVEEAEAETVPLYGPPSQHNSPHLSSLMGKRSLLSFFPFQPLTGLPSLVNAPT
jgi:hypothetical protein